MSMMSASPDSSATISNPRWTPLCAAVVLLGLWSVAAQAGDGSDHELAHRLHEKGDIVSLESVVAKARAIRPGDLLEVELSRHKANYVYEVEILDADGQVWDLKFQAADGQLIKEEPEKH